MTIAFLLLLLLQQQKIKWVACVFRSTCQSVLTVYTYICKSAYSFLVQFQWTGLIFHIWSTKWKKKSEKIIQCTKKNPIQWLNQNGNAHQFKEKDCTTQRTQNITNQQKNRQQKLKKRIARNKINNRIT